MKTSLLIAILTLGLLPGMSPKAEAQNCGQQSRIYISGYQRCGTPVYRVRYIAGYDRCGQAVWRVRNAYRSELSGYRTQYRPSHRYSGYGQSRVTYSTSSGRGYTYRYSNSSPSRYYSSSSSRCR